MRKCRNENNERRFTREEWLTSNQIKSFFSRLAAARKKLRREIGAEDERDVDPTQDVDDSEVEFEERVCQINDIVDQIGIQHPSSMTSMTCVSITKMINVAYLMLAC